MHYFLEYFFLSGCIKRRQVNLVQECINKMTNCFIRLFCLNLSSSQEAHHLGCINWRQEPAGECSNHSTKLGVNYLPEGGKGKRKNVAPPLSDTFFIFLTLPPLTDNPSIPTATGGFTL